MPKVGMEPIRRDQIRRAAAGLIAKVGFSGTTLRDVAKAAEVSTGTINHYYDSKLAMLTDTLTFVSETTQKRIRTVIDAAPPGEAKLRALVRACIFAEEESADIGQAVWIWALAEAVRSEPLMATVAERRRLFQDIITGVLVQIDPDWRPEPEVVLTFAAELDAHLNGLYFHRITGETRMNPMAVEEAIVIMARARIRWPRATAAASTQRDRQTA